MECREEFEEQHQVCLQEYRDFYDSCLTGTKLRFRSTLGGIFKVVQMMMMKIASITVSWLSTPSPKSVLVTISVQLLVTINQAQNPDQIIETL